jgi:hypothetical protein
MMNGKSLKFLVIGQFVVIAMLAVVYLGSNDSDMGVDNLQSVSDKISSMVTPKATGSTLVNGDEYDGSSKIEYGDVIESGDEGFVFKASGDVFKMKPHTKIELKEKTDSVKRIVNLIAGGVLAAFAKEEKDIKLASYGTIGIRGTALYASVDKDKAYICSCYGKIDVYSTDHDRKVLLYSINPKGTKKSPYHQAVAIHHDHKDAVAKTDGMFHHTDAELAKLEKIAGRRTPF